MRIRLINIIQIIGVVAADLVIYFVLFLLMMSYDDRYNESMGPYLSWKSMNTTERAVYLVLNGWHLVNIIAVCYTGYRIYHWLKRRNRNVFHQK